MSNVLFRSRRQYVVALGIGFALCVLISGLFRHYGDPHKYPLVTMHGGIPTPVRKTFAVDRDKNPYDSLTRWRAIDTGDFRPIYDAARSLQTDPAAPMYRPEQLRENRSAFVYTPFTAMLLAPLIGPGVEPAWVADQVSLANHVMWLAAGVLLFLVVTQGRNPTINDAVLFCLHYAVFYPLAKTLQLTQAGIWIFFCFVASTFLLQRKREMAAGFALALGVSIKPHLAAILFLVALIPRFPRRMLFSCLVGLLLTTGASLWYAGPRNCLDYALVTLPTLSAGYAYYPNQSINGLLLRLFTDLDPATFNLAPVVPWIKGVSVAWGLCVLLAAGILIRQASVAGPRAEDQVLPYSLAVAAAVIASPVCWIHHFTVLIIPFAVAVRHFVNNPEHRSRFLDGALFVSFLLVGFFFDSRNLGGWPMALFSAFEFYGAVLLLACLFLMTRRSTDSDNTVPVAT